MRQIRERGRPVPVYFLFEDKLLGTSRPHSDVESALRLVGRVLTVPPSAGWLRYLAQLRPGVLAASSRQFKDRSMSCRGACKAAELFSLRNPPP
jgi:hypothetical protein